MIPPSPPSLFPRALPLLLLFLSGSATARDENNLVPNGSLDEGRESAAHWERANGLTTFYETEPGRGRIVRMDTGVERKQALAWQQAFQEDPSRPPPAKTPIAPDSYASIGGNEGVMLDSALIPCVPGQAYRLSADVKGVGKPFIWIKGFLWHPARKTWVDGYQTRLEPDQISTSVWRTCSIGFHPTAKSPRIAKFKVRLYAYWPNGLYFFDNIRVEAISDEAFAEHVRQRDRAP